MNTAYSLFVPLLLVQQSLLIVHNGFMQLFVLLRNDVYIFFSSQQLRVQNRNLVDVFRFLLLILPLGTLNLFGQLFLYFFMDQVSVFHLQLDLLDLRNQLLIELLQFFPLAFVKTGLLLVFVQSWCVGLLNAKEVVSDGLVFGN